MNLVELWKHLSKSEKLPLNAAKLPVGNGILTNKQRIVFSLSLAAAPNMSIAIVGKHFQSIPRLRREHARRRFHNQQPFAQHFHSIDKPKPNNPPDKRDSGSCVPMAKTAALSPTMGLLVLKQAQKIQIKCFTASAVPSTIGAPCLGPSSSNNVRAGTAAPLCSPPLPHASAQFAQVGFYL